MIIRADMKAKCGVRYCIMVVNSKAMNHIGQLPRVSREDPERIRVDSVFETSVGQLPRLSTEDEDRVVSVFEFRVCSLSVCSL